MNNRAVTYYNPVMNLLVDSQLGYIMLYHVISCCIMLYHVISCYSMLYHVISCYIMLYHVLSCYIPLRQSIVYLLTREFNPIMNQLRP